MVRGGAIADGCAARGAALDGLNAAWETAENLVLRWMGLTQRGRLQKLTCQAHRLRPPSAPQTPHPRPPTHPHTALATACGFLLAAGAPLLVAACAAAAHPLLPLWAVGMPVSSLLTLAWRHALAPDTLWRGQLAAIAAVALLVARTLRGALASAKVWLPLLLCAALAVAALACAGAV